MTFGFGIPVGSGTRTGTTTVAVGAMNVQPNTAISTTADDRDRYLNGGTEVINLPQLEANVAPTEQPASTGPAGSLQLPGGSPINEATHTATLATLPNVTPTEAFLDAAAATSLIGITPRQTAAAIRPLQYSQDQLSVADYEVKNDVFQQIGKNGIASFRPEVLSTIDFLPLVEKARILAADGESRLETTPAGDFFDIQYRGLMLRQETLVRFIKTIERASARMTGARQVKQDLSSIRDSYEKTLKQIERSVGFYTDAITSLNVIRDTINIKTIPSNLFNTKDYLALDRFFEKKMQYSLDKFAIFSDTKILSQLLFDFRSIMEAYSISLLNLTDTDRLEDTSPVSIDKTYTLADQFTFNIASLRSENSTGINATDPQFFSSFVSSLPDNPDDRIKILSLVLSKEFRVSKGLGKPDNKRALQLQYGSSDQGNPFDNIVGGIGGTIFEPATGNNSLASILHIELPNNSQVLPFESKYVDAEPKTIYVPGSAYFVDSIINVTDVKKPEFNSGPFLQFVGDYDNKLLSARKLIEDLFEINNPQSSLRASQFSDVFMTSVKTSIDGLKDATSINTDQAVVLALLKLANTDNVLKNMLFQYVLLLGMCSNGSDGEKTIFKALATELKDISALSAVRVPQGYHPNMFRGLAEIRTYVEKLANDIEDKVYELTVRALSPALARGVGTRGVLGSSRPAFTSMAVTTEDVRNYALRTWGAGPAAINDIYSLQIQRGSIARTLIAAATSKQDNATNILQEFLSVVDFANTAAQTQGLSNYLLPDNSNRTRYNFIGVSTQMLMFFEIFSAYVKKYAFASFENSVGSMTATIKIDTVGNRLCAAYLEELTTHTAPQLMAALPNQMFQTTTPAFSPSAVQIAPGGETAASPRQQTSVNLLNQASADVASVFQNSNVFNSLLATNPQEASSMLNIGNFGLLGFQATGIPFVLLASRYSSLRTSLSAIRNKLADEDQTIANVLHILSVIGVYLKQGASKIQGFFNQQNLATFLSENSISDLQLLQNPSQVRMAAYILDLVKDKNPASTFSEDVGTVNSNVIISDVLTKEEHSAILSYFSQAKFLPENLADKKIKVLSVGIPANFSKHLSDRVNLQDINARTFRDKQFDVVSLNVYKRDARFDDIVFKPQKFLFDLSMFQRESDIVKMNVRPLEEFRIALQRAVATDYQNVLKRSTVTPQTIASDPKYAFLSSNEQQDLIANQVSSYLLGSYIALLTGMKIYEDEFLLTPYVQGTYTDARVTDLVFNYLRTIEKVRINNKATIQELLTDPTLGADAKDLIRLVTYGSFVFEPEYIKASVLRPKLFDRIFHIPLDIDSFEIDEQATNATQSGRLSYRSSYVQNQLRRVDNKVYLKVRQDGDLIMEDYFITVESL